MSGIKQQLGGVGKGAVKQIVAEPLELLKDASSQVSGVERGASAGQNAEFNPPQETKATLPSVEEQKRKTILSAHRNELDEIVSQKRKVREKKELQQEAIEKKQKEQVTEQKKAEKESMFQRIFRAVRKRSRGEIKPGMPKAA